MRPITRVHYHFIRGGLYRKREPESADTWEEDAAFARQVKVSSWPH